MIVFNYLVMCLVFGTTFLAIKIGIDAGAPPFFSAGLRFFLAGLVLFGWMVGTKGEKFSLLWRKEHCLTGLGLTFGTFAALYWAEQYVTSGIAAVLSATGPLMILILQTIVFRQPASIKSLIGCLVGFFGVILLLLPSIRVQADWLWMMGCLIILVSEIFYATGTLYSRKVIQRFSGSSPISLNAAQMIYGGLMLMILSFITESVHLDSFLRPQVMGSLFYLIVVGSMIGHTIYYWLVAKTNPIFPSTWLYVSPLIALVLGSVLYHEQITWMTMIGACTILIGILIVNFDGLRAGLRQIIQRPKKLTKRKASA